MEKRRKRDSLSSSSASSASGADSRGAETRVARASRSLYKLAGMSEYNCGYCLSGDTILRLCGNCRTVAYCSTQCQHQDWARHKAGCKQKNPTYFNKEARSRIKWFLDLVETRPNEEDGSDLLTYLVDSFRLRCFDEQQITGHLPRQEEILLKFTRFLHAAKGTGVLPATFNKLDYISARNDAMYRHKITEISQGRGMEEMYNRYPNSKQAIDDLRALHNVICGPLLIGTEKHNLI